MAKSRGGGLRVVYGPGFGVSHAVPCALPAPKAHALAGAHMPKEVNVWLQLLQPGRQRGRAHSLGQPGVIQVPLFRQ